MKDHELRKRLDFADSSKKDDVIDRLAMRVFCLEASITRLTNALMEKCTYCGEWVKKGETYETGEKYKVITLFCNPHKACDACLAKLSKTCEAAKTGYENKAKKEGKVEKKKGS